MPNRLVNPRRRIVTIPFTGGSGGGGGAAAAVLSSFTFETDSVIHWVESQVQMSLDFPPGTTGFCVIGGGFDDCALNPILSMSCYVHLYRIGVGFPVAVPAPFTQVLWKSTDMGSMVVPAGSQFHIVMQSNNGGGEGSFTLQFNSLAEWNNFRDTQTR